MMTTERRALLLGILRRDGRLVAKDASRDLGLSEDTIRRDLRDLAGEGLLQRVHGGALPASAALADLPARKGIQAEGKAVLARRGAEMVRPGQVVFLDGGTTAVQLARALPDGLDATVVTHSPSVAVELAAHRSLRVELVGGRLFRHSMVAVGAAAAEAISRIRADLFFMGVTGVHPEAGLTTGDAEEAAVKRLFHRQAGETVVMASREKLGAVSPFLIAKPGDIDVLLVEPGASEAVVEAYRRLGVGVEVA